MNTIKAAIFDMDGLLIDSEPLWQEAEVEAFGTVDLHLNDKLCSQTKGLRIDEVVKYWYTRHKWQSVSCKEIELKIIDLLSKLIIKKAEPMEGVTQVISTLKSKNIKISLCSSSPKKIILAVLNKFKLFDSFEVIHSAEDEEFGKPHPAVYINTAKKLNVDRRNCLAFEDSMNGMLSAKAASIKVVGVPEKDEYNDTRFDFCDYKLRSLKDFEYEKAQLLFYKY